MEDTPPTNFANFFFIFFLMEPSPYMISCLGFPILLWEVTGRWHCIKSHSDANFFESKLLTSCADLLMISHICKCMTHVKSQTTALSSNNISFRDNHSKVQKYEEEQTEPVLTQPLSTKKLHLHLQQLYYPTESKTSEWRISIWKLTTNASTAVNQCENKDYCVAVKMPRRSIGLGMIQFLAVAAFLNSLEALGQSNELQVRCVNLSCDSIVIFWQSNCAGCRGKSPVWDGVQRKHSTKVIVFIFFGVGRPQSSASRVLTWIQCKFRKHCFVRYGTCWTIALKDLEAGCKNLDDEVQSRQEEWRYLLRRWCGCECAQKQLKFSKINIKKPVQN